MGASLYELTGEFLNLQEMLEDPDSDPVLVEEALKALNGSLDAKFEGYIKVLRNMEGEVVALDTELTRLQALKKTRAAAIDRIRSQIAESMKATGRTKIKSPLGTATLSVRRNGTLVIDDQEEIPSQFLKVETSVMRSELKKWLKDHPDCEFAHLEDAESLRLS